MGSERLVFKIPQEFADKRLDQFLSTVEQGISRHLSQKLIKEGFVFVNDKKNLNKSYKLKKGDWVVLYGFGGYFPPAEQLCEKPMSIEFLYDDEHLFAIDKPAGLTVHPGSGNRQDTLVNALLYYKNRFDLKLSNIQGDERWGIVHRLDKDTSGVMLLAKTNDSHSKLQALFKDRQVQKQYLAVVHGNLKNDKYLIDIPLGRDKSNRKKISSNSANPKKALSEVSVCKRGSNYSFIKVFPHTGRTHQIRAHLKEIKHPVVGDVLYSGKNYNILSRYFVRQNARLRLMLHSFKILFAHPCKCGNIEIKSRLPCDFINCYKQLRKYYG